MSDHIMMSLSEAVTIDEVIAILNRISGEFKNDSVKLAEIGCVKGSRDWMTAAICIEDAGHLIRKHTED